MDLLQKIKENAKQHNKRIVLPEGTEERTLQAADILLKENIARIILIANPDELKKEVIRLGLKNIGKAVVIDPKNHEKIPVYADILSELRKDKGVSREKAMELVQDPLYLATLMIKAGDADGEVAGALNTTGDVLRPAFQIVKTMPGISVVSGAFIMIMKDKTYGDNGIDYTIGKAGKYVLKKEFAGHE